MDNQIPGLFLEETAGIVLLFWFGYVLLLGLIIYGAVLLYVRRGKRDRCIGFWFSGGAATAFFLRTMI